MTKVLSVLFWGFMHLQGVTPLVHSFEEEKMKPLKLMKAKPQFLLAFEALGVNDAVGANLLSDLEQFVSFMGNLHIQM